MLPFALAMGAFLIWGSYTTLERVRGVVDVSRESTRKAHTA